MNILHKMVHECLQGNIISEDRLRCHAASVTTGRVSGGWVQLGQKETCLRSASIADNETG